MCFEELFKGIGEDKCICLHMGLGVEKQPSRLFRI
jgi:hypothetical protein